MTGQGRDAYTEVANAIRASPLSRSSSSSTLATGAQVRQTFTNSPVNVISGDQHNTNIITIRELTPNQGIEYEKLIAIVNDNTRQDTASAVCEDFMNESLHEPDFEVYPQMKEVSVDDYYKGGHYVAYSSEGSTHRDAAKKGFRNQLTKEVGFYHQHGNDGKSITIEEVISSISKPKKLGTEDVVGVTAIVSSAGSGKTTLARRIARKALEIHPTEENNEDASFSKPKLRMIHYIELKEMKEEESIKASNFLFGGLFERESEEIQTFQWLIGHQSEAVIIFDGLDQAMWDFVENKIKPYQKATTSSIMYNILARNILRHVKIIVTSREFKISELPALARPSSIITLTGFTQHDAHKLFTYLIKENPGEEIWKVIETTSPRLFQLVSVPIFLILVAVVMGRDPRKTPPSTVTELYNRIVSVLQSVNNIRNHKQILSIINKLKAMAFHGIEDGRVVFDESDLTQFGLSAAEVQDLMTKVPGNNILSRHLMEGDFRFFFCHQSMQEFLAASFVSEMDLQEFVRFNDTHLHEKQWSVVRRFVTGVVYMKYSNDLHRVSDQARKQQVLAQSIRLQLEKNWDKLGCMELYTAIYESDDDYLTKDLSVINVSHISLSHDEAHIVGSIAARNECLESLDLADCSIDDELFITITKCLKNRIHVNRLDLLGNNLSATAVGSLLGHRRIELLSGNLDWDIATLTAGGWTLQLRNGDYVIKISRGTEGQFDVEDSTLVFERVPALAPVVFCWRLFDAKFMTLGEQQHIYAKQHDLAELSMSQLGKISKIVLNGTEDRNIAWTLIETSLNKHRIDLLDIAVNGQITANDYKQILEQGRNISALRFNVIIHAMFYVGRGDDFGNIVEACQEKKIEYLRCIFEWGCCASLDEISSLVNYSNSKKVTLIYRAQSDVLRDDGLKKVQKIAYDLDTELEVLELQGRVEDAWKRLDVEFYFKEYLRKQ